MGGGGIPVTRNAKGELRGVAAVIDKDLASGLLATRLDADLLLISTGVERVALHFGTPEQVDLDRLTVAEARAVHGGGPLCAGEYAAQDRGVHPLLDCQPQSACLLRSSPTRKTSTVRCAARRERGSCGNKTNM